MKQKIGGSYIKCRLKWIAAVIGCGIVMTAVLFLNEVPAGEIAYGMLLCLGILLFAVTMDGISYGRRHRELFALQQSITVSLENLPEPGEILEEDYQRLLGILAEEKMRIWNTAVSEKRDLMEYYTMWVHQIKTPIAALKLLIEEEVDIPGEEEPLGEDRERLQQQREKRRDEHGAFVYASRIGDHGLCSAADRSRRSDPDGGAPLCETFYQQEDRTALRGDGGTCAHR